VSKVVVIGQSKAPDGRIDCLGERHAAAADPTGLLTIPAHHPGAPS
jgi:hypothetical protein